MGLLLSCGTSCTWQNTQVELDKIDGDYYRIERDTTLTFRWRWANAPFPAFTPCPDPQSFRLFWRRRTKGTSTWTTWSTVPDSKTACSDSGTELVNTSDSLPVAATAGVWYEIEIFFCEKGWYELIIDSDCSVGNQSEWKSRPIRVVVT